MRRSLLLVALLGGGCSSPTSTGNGFTATDATSFAMFITNNLIDAMNQKSASVPANGLTIQSTAGIYYSISSVSHCADGGQISDVGHESGSYNPDSGVFMLLLQVEQSISDCQMDGFLFEVDPYLWATGTLVIGGASAVTASVSLGGGFSYDGHPAQVDLSLRLPTVANSESHLSGSVAGYTIDQSW